MSTAGENGGTPRGTFTPAGFKSRIEALTFLIQFGPGILPISEFLVLLFHAERSLTYGKKSDAASLSQMTNGIHRQGGGWIRGGAGVTKSTATAANLQLERRGLLKRTQRDSPRRGHGATEYEVRWADVAGLVEKYSSGDTLDRLPDKPLSDKRTSARPIAGQALSDSRTHRGNNTEGNHHQRKLKQKKSAAAAGSTNGESVKQKQNPFAQKAADDDSSPSVQTPETRLKAWAANRGDPLSRKDWWDITAEAEVRGLGLADLADLAERNNGDWRSSGAGLRWLVKQYSPKASAVPGENPTEAGNAPTKCECKGLGVIQWEPERVYCECAMGSEVRKADQRIAADAQKAIAAVPPSTRMIERGSEMTSEVCSVTSLSHLGATA
jgi:hypothetical protein